MAFTIRAPRAADAPVIADLHVATWKEAYAHLLPADPEADWFSRSVAAEGVPVLSVDYRLAPISLELARRFGIETRSGWHAPAQVDEVLAALGWARESALSIADGR